MDEKEMMAAETTAAGFQDSQATTPVPTPEKQTMATEATEAMTTTTSRTVMTVMTQATTAATGSATPAMPSDPPNGGFLAWLQVAGAFFLFFNSWGIVNAFGSFQEYYEEVLLPDRSPSDISWVGSFQGFCVFIVGIIVGPVLDRGYLRTVLLIGTFLVVFGIMMTSLSTQYYQIFLAQGLVTGCGLSFLTMPSISVPSSYFTTRRALALGITTSGGSTGAVLFPIIFRRTVGPLGFGWATRLIGFICLATLLFSISILRLRVPPRSKSLIDWSFFREPPSVALCCAMLFNFMGLYIPFFYLPTFYAVSLSRPGDSMSFYVLSITNASSLFGRIVAGLVADRLGPMNTVVPIALVNAAMLFAWIGIHSVAGTIVFAVIYGFFSGAVISVALTIVAHMAPSLNVIATRIGMISLFSGFGLLVGNPIAGAVIDLERSVFWKAQVFSGTILAGNFGLLCVARIARARDVPGWKM